MSLRTAAVTLALLLPWSTPALLGVADPANGVGKPVIAVPRDDAWWRAKHAAVLARIKCDPDTDLIMIGDSITQNYEKSDPPYENFQPIWQEFYAPRDGLNLGYSGDTTENVLWRLNHGEVDGIAPRAAVVMIGTNNIPSDSAAETESGIDAVIGTIERKLPSTKILLLGILPSGRANPIEERRREVNGYLAGRYAEDDRVTYLDVGSILYKDGVLQTNLFYDPKEYGAPALHPDTTGQRLMAEAIEPTLTRLFDDGARKYLATLGDVNTAVIPVPRLEMDSYDWYARHREILAIEKRVDPQIVLIGDSITHFWAGMPTAHRASGKQAWETAFHGLSVLNLGFGWDRTQNVLWRIAHGELDGIHPATVVLNIGTNNLVGTDHARANTPREIADGVLAIVDAVRAKLPNSRIIVMGIFPRGHGACSPLREPIKQVNELLVRSLQTKTGTVFLDIGNRFLEPDGTLPTGMMFDGTHPTQAGYEVWAKALLDAGVRSKDSPPQPDERASLIEQRMTTAQMLQVVDGKPGMSFGPKQRKPAGAIGSAGFIPAIAQLGIPALQESDASLGVADPANDAGKPVRGAAGYSTALPSQLATAATWNPQLAYQAGAMIGHEAHDEGFDVMLAGGADLTRDPRNGRNFEYAGEDPLLAGTIAGNSVAGIQSQHVISTMKHYALNDQETNRQGVSSDIARGAARESDLLAFEIGIEIGNPGAMMCAYNKVNGIYSCGNDYLLNQTLKHDWRYPGFVMSDWGAVHGVGDANAGLDQESADVFDREPYFGKALAQAVAHGRVSLSRLHDMVHRILRSMFAVGVVDSPPVVRPIDASAD
ncbi:MAG TPA: GDSL-type esterase/lipase family protein, partial [Candidatus Baltobacteraceae bacterium]|nr:GDSL-type esterase/lipase family protein [Candidatus Baltobacteraceae bacterium]